MCGDQSSMSGVFPQSFSTFAFRMESPELLCLPGLAASEHLGSFYHDLSGAGIKESPSHSALFMGAGYLKSGSYVHKANIILLTEPSP